MPHVKVKAFVVTGSVGLRLQLFYLSVGFKLHLCLLEPLVCLSTLSDAVKLLVNTHPVKS